MLSRRGRKRVWCLPPDALYLEMRNRSNLFRILVGTPPGRGIRSEKRHKGRMSRS
ncbi:hypothetical protein D9M68_501590 [compost metagenome]